MEAATAALEALTVAGGEGVLPVLNGSRGHSPLSLGGTSPVPGAGGGAMPVAGGPVQMGGGPVPAAGGPVAQPNPENKLFVGGAPPGTDEETLKKIFEDHGEVEEVFLMRGGSRSGQACDLGLGQMQQRTDLLVDRERLQSGPGDRAQGQFGIARGTDLADDEKVERRAEVAGDGGADPLRATRDDGYLSVEFHGLFLVSRRKRGARCPLRPVGGGRCCPRAVLTRAPRPCDRPRRRLG